MANKRLLEFILDLNELELKRWVKDQCEEQGIKFDESMIDGMDKQALYDFIAINLHPRLEEELHSKHQSPEVGFPTPANSEIETDLDKAAEHKLNKL